jgi:predicted kinase
MIVLMAGLPASGKSTLCVNLAARLSGTVLDKDRLRSALFAERDIEYSTEQDDLCVKILLEVAAFILKKDPSRSVFLDGRPFSRTYQIDEVLKTAAVLKQDWRILECVCSEETARKRLAEHENSGEHPAGNRNYELYERVKAEFEEIKLAKAVIDTDQPLDACIERALKALSRNA